MGRHSGEDAGDRTVEYVRSALQDTAETYQPDRTAMINRVAAGRASPAAGARPALRIFRPAGAALAVVVILLLSVVAVQAGHGDHRRGPVAAPPAGVRTTTAAAGTTGPAPAGPATTYPGAAVPGTNVPGTNGTPRAHPAGTGATSVPPTTATTTGTGFLTCAGAVDPHSVATWSQNNVVITNRTALVSLSVTITVALTPGATDAGRYTTVPNADVTMTVTRQPAALIYTYVLRDGTTLIPGNYVFAAQFQHRSGRDGRGDSYTVAARTSSAGTQLGGAFG